MIILQWQHFIMKIKGKSYLVDKYLLTSRIILGLSLTCITLGISAADVSKCGRLTVAKAGNNVYHVICSNRNALIPGDTQPTSITNILISPLVTSKPIITLPTPPPSPWTNTKTARCRADNFQDFIEQCLIHLDGLVVGANTSLTPPKWVLSFNSSVEPLGLSTTQTQNNMKMNTVSSEVPDIRCVGPDAVFFSLFASVSTGDGFLPETTHSVANPCESEESFECVTSLKIKDSSEYVPITMPEKPDCSSLSGPPSDCTVTTPNKFVYYCPAP